MDIGYNGGILLLLFMNVHKNIIPFHVFIIIILIIIYLLLSRTGIDFSFNHYPLEGMKLCTLLLTHLVKRLNPVMRKK